jgi:hypothetical protein
MNMKIADGRLTNEKCKEKKRIKKMNMKIKDSRLKHEWRKRELKS